MKKYLPFLICLFFSLSSADKIHSQDVTLDWVKNILGYAGTALEIGKNGDIYIIGEFKGTTEFDPGIGNPSMTSAGLDDVFIYKINNNGSLIWARTFGGIGSDRAWGLAIDSFDNIYITGLFNDVVDFDPGIGVYNLDPMGESVYINKLDSSGNFIWARSFKARWSTSIAVDKFGNIYTTGHFDDSVDFDPGPGQYYLKATNWDIFINKLDTNGDFVWAKQIGGNGYCNANDIHIDGDGNIYTTGSFNGSVDFDPGIDTFYLVSQHSIYINKLSNNGDFIWAKQFGPGWGVGNDLETDKNGNIYFTGYFEDSVDFDPGPDTFLLTTSPESTSIFVCKLDQNGNLIWAKCTDIGWVNVGNSLTIDSSGNIYIVGHFNHLTDFDPGPDTFLVGAGDMNTFIWKLDNYGNFSWVVNFPGFLLYNEGYDIKLDANGNIYTTGRAVGPVGFDPDPGINFMAASGAFIHKMKPGLSGISTIVNQKTLIKLYPNPTSNSILLETHEDQNLQITIYDITGKAISKKVINTSGKTELEIEGSPGNYFIEVVTEQGERQIFKIVKM